jgi:hypothetical protein
MATSLPQEGAWPAKFRKHATQLSKYLKDTLLYIERTKDQPVPYDLARTIAIGALSLINKINNIPDVSTIYNALRIARTEAKIAAESTI